MLDKIMIVILIFLIVSLIYKYYSMKNKTTREGFDTGQLTINTLEQVLSDKTGGIQGLFGHLDNNKEHIVEKKTSGTENYYKLKEEGAKQYFPEPWKTPSDWKIEGDGVKSNDVSFNVYWNDNLKETDRKKKKSDRPSRLCITMY